MLKLIALSAGLVAAGALHAQTTPLTLEDANARIMAAGYDTVRSIEQDDGFWEAEVRAADGRWVDIRVHPTSGKVYSDDTKPKVDAATVSSLLTAAGYTDVHDIDFDDGVWTVDARNSSGAKVDLAVDPDDGSVLVERPDD